MRRDWWKIRHVLLAVRDGKDIRADDETSPYHLHLCLEAGFVDGGLLTWEGQEAAALLEDADVLQEVLAELETLGAPWEVLRAVLRRKRWPEPEPKAASSDGMFHWTEEKKQHHVPQTKRCPLCEGSGIAASGTSKGSATTACPVCHGARVIKE
jgi:hypothetical protein